MDGSPIVLLAALMGIVTYGTRVIPFLVPIDRLPPRPAAYLRLMGPASMAAVAAVAVASPLAGSAPGSTPEVVWLASGLCVVIVALRKSLAWGVAGALAVTLLGAWSEGAVVG